MTPQMKIGIAGVVIGLLLLIFAPWWLALGVIVIAIAIPVAGYAMLDPGQRRRLKGIRSRRQLGR